MKARWLVTIVATAGLAGISSASDGPPYGSIQNEDLPMEIQVNELVFTETSRFIGDGKQVYDCMNGVYTGREPIANLLRINTGRQVGIHFAGPNWAHNDGSRVTAKVMASVASPEGPQHINWLLLESTANFGADGLHFSGTQLIQRVLTRRGKPPASCSPSDPQTVSINYSTLYIFYDEV